PIDAIQRSCREQLEAARVPENQRPDLSDPKRLPMLSLPAWRVVMQMDQNSNPLPAKLGMHLDKDENLLQIDLPSPDAIPTVPAGPADDFDLLEDRGGDGDVRAGAIQHLHTGTQKISLWPLQAVTRPASTTAASSARTA